MKNKNLSFKSLFWRKPRCFLVAFLMVSFIMVLASSYGTVPQEQKPLQPKIATLSQKKEITRDFNITGRSREMVDFEVTTAGRIEARAEWSGTATSLALILNGPGMAQAYARKDGQSPLSLSFEVTGQHLSLGKMWKVTVANFSSSTAARGRVLITHPGAPGVSPYVTPKEKEKEEIPEEKKEKSIKIKHYEIQQAQGFTAQQLEEIKAKLEEQKIEQTKAKMEKRIREISPKNPLAKIVVPLVYKQMEEKTQRRLMVKRIDVTPRFQTIVQAYNNISPSLKSQYFHPRYAQLKPGDRIDKLQLGKDILSAVKPNYETEIRQMVRRAFSPGSPKFQLSSAKIPRVGVAKVERPQVKPGPLQFQQLETLSAKLKTSPTAANLKELKDFVQAQGFRTADISHNQLHQTLVEQLHLNPQVFVPDLNNDHSIRDYHKYEIGLDWFYCIDQNERTCVWIPFVGTVCSDDEPYWHISASIPRYDPDDPEHLHQLHTGDLYSVSSRVTGTYEDVNNGETRVFRSQDRWVVNANTYNTSTTFMIDLWEEDWSKEEVRHAIQDAIQDLRETLISTIKEAVLNALQQALYDSLREALPAELQGVLQLFFQGKLSFSSFLDSVQTAMGGIDVGMLVLEIIFSGKSLTEIISGLGGACPELTIALMALKVAGPIVVDLFQGDFEEALKGLLYLPITIFNYIIDFFTDIVDFFANLLAIIDPDDQIQTRSITIGASSDQIFKDAPWGDSYSPAVSSTPSGCGPKSSNSSLIMGGNYVQPILRFEGADAKYRVYYNVRRILVGGRETFGFTTKVYPDSTWNQTRTYKAKSMSRGDKIKVSYCILNADGDPLIVLSEKNGRASGTNLGTTERVFYVDVIPGAEYELRITNLFGRGDIYGYITLEEK